MIFIYQLKEARYHNRCEYNEYKCNVLHINQLTDDDFKVENLILQELPQAHTRKIKQIISKHIDNHQLSTSENKIQQLLVHLILIIKHSQPEEEDWSTDTESLTIAKKCIKDINETLGYQLNNKTSECFSFLLATISISLI